MRKLPLYLLFSGALLGSNFTMAKMVEGYEALSLGKSQDAYALFSKEAKHDPQAKFVLAMMNLEGIGTPKDLLAAEKWLKMAMEEGSEEARYNLGILRLEGKLGTKAGEYSGLELLQQSSKAQFELATIRLGIELIEGEGLSEFFTTDTVQNIYQRLEQSLNAGNGFAGFILGIYWSDAEKFEIDETNYQTAVDYLEKSYALGFLPAMMGLAALYSDGGYGLEANPEKAAQFQALILSNQAMIRNFESLLPGLLQINSLMTPAEQKQVLRLLEKEAQKNVVPAISQLITYYSSGIGAPVNPEKIATYLQQLETIKSGESLFALGNYFLQRNREAEGIRDIKAAAEEDYIPAIQWLSDPLNHPWNTDREVIAQYVLQGANLGDSKSIHAFIDHLEEERRNVGWWNENTRPIALINQEIFQWAEKLQAVAPNAPETLILLANLYLTGTGIEEDSSKAFNYLLEAYHLAPTNEIVLLSLAQLYQTGKGTDQDLILAAEFYLKAKAENPSIESIEGLLRLNQMTVGFKGYRAFQSQILGKPLTEYDNQNQYVPILDHLLDALEHSIEETQNETIYAYLLADRYFSQYLQFAATIQQQEEIALQTDDPSDLEALKELQAQRDHLLTRADDLFQNAYDHSEQAKLHYAQALLILQSQEKDPLEAEALMAKAQLILRNIKSLSAPLLSIGTTVSSDNAREEKDNPYRLTEKEQLSAIKTIIPLLHESPALQTWFGEQVLPHNPQALEKLRALASEDDAPLFAIYYVGIEEIRKGNTQGYQAVMTAANQQFLPAIRYLANLYHENNRDVIQALGGTSMQAITWYEKGSALKDDASTYALAEIYFERKMPMALPAGEAYLKALFYYDQLEDPDYRFANYHRREVQARVEEYQEIQTGVKNRDPEALQAQSEIYRYGRYGEAIDLVKADEYLVMAADLGSIKAMYDFYQLYRDDQTISGELLARFNRYHIAYVLASKEDWETQRLADRYLNGDRIPESRKKAREYYELALQNDSGSSASYDLGNMDRFDQNRPLAERGNAEAMLVIGRAYRTGSGVKKDLEKAYPWLEKSAKAGNQDAAFYFGVLVQEGIISPMGEVIIAPDWTLALEWYAKASDRFKNAISGRIAEYETIYQPAQEGDPLAMVALADLHQRRYLSNENPYDQRQRESGMKKA